MQKQCTQQTCNAFRWYSKAYSTYSCPVLTVFIKGKFFFCKWKLNVRLVDWHDIVHTHQIVSLFWAYTVTTSVIGHDSWRRLYFTSTCDSQQANNLMFSFTIAWLHIYTTVYIVYGFNYFLPLAVNFLITIIRFSDFLPADMSVEVLAYTGTSVGHVHIISRLSSGYCQPRKRYRNTCWVTII